MGGRTYEYQLLTMVTILGRRELGLPFGLKADDPSV